LPWTSSAGAIASASKHDNGAWSIADPRAIKGDIRHSLPDGNERMIAVIKALDGTWHRPFTTLELAVLQGLIEPEEYLQLSGTSHTSWRERIGNMVPPKAAKAIASMMGETLLLAWAGESFVLSATPIWVRNIAIATSLDLPNRKY
ncbi:hypothetical protein, partial [Pseudoalteromonas galatheae]